MLVRLAVFLEWKPIFQMMMEFLLSGRLQNTVENRISWGNKIRLVSSSSFLGLNDLEIIPVKYICNKTVVLNEENQVFVSSIREGFEHN